MIISRTPFRISFFGGGTEYPNWYRTHGGSVLSACRILPPFFRHKTRIVYSAVENCGSIDEIQHPAVREVLRFLRLDHGLEIHHDGDLPARSGMGSDSSFTVGLLQALHALLGVMPSKKRLARESIHIEQNLIKEDLGLQDQVCAAYGGINRIDFSKAGEFDVHPIPLSPGRIEQLNSHLMLFFTKLEPAASELVRGYVENAGAKCVLMKQLQEMVESSIDVLQSDTDICEFGQLLHKAWTLRRSLRPDVSNSHVDELYERARAAGAVGGKITGATGGGFLLLLVPPPARQKVRQALAGNIHVPFQFEFSGSQIIFYKPEGEYYRQLHTRRARQIGAPGDKAEALSKSQRIVDVSGPKSGKDEFVRVTPSAKAAGETAN